MSQATFLDPGEVGEFTGIKRGKTVGGVLISRERLQVDQLRRMGVPFYENARGRPLVARAAVEGRSAPAPEAPRRGWVPRVMQR